MKFCPKCGTMLNTVVEEGRRWLVCPRCGHKEEQRSSIVIREDISEGKYKTSGVVEIERPEEGEFSEEARASLLESLAEVESESQE